MPPETLRALVKGIKAQGATTYMEVVSTSAEAALNSARVAREIGVARLLGGTQVDEILAILAEQSHDVSPVPGQAGRASHEARRLGGGCGEADCRRFAAKGCAGVDLLCVSRDRGEDPLDLVRAARRGTPGYLLVAGSVGTAAQIVALAAAGCRRVHDRLGGRVRWLVLAAPRLAAARS